MLSCTLDFHNWRLFKENQLQLQLGNTLIYAQNGSGKTTLLAALYALYTGEPWPGTNWRNHIQTGEQYFGITVVEYPQWYASGLISPKGRIVTRYSGDVPEQYRYTPLMYHPDDNRWLVLSRNNKLAVLDHALVAMCGKTYQSLIKRLDTLVLSKARLIKNTLTTQLGADMILVNEIHQGIVQCSCEIWKYRTQLLQDFSSVLPEFSQWIQTTLASYRVRYIQSFGNHKLNGFEKQTFPDIEAVWQKELDAGRVLYGAQRDDFELEFNQQKAETFLSRGENRALTVFFKRFVRSKISGRVLWLLDDFFNEFDSVREHTVLASLFQKDDWIIATSTRKIAGFEHYISL